MLKGGRQFGWRWGWMGVLFLVALGVRVLRGWQEVVVNPDAIRFIDQGREMRVNFLGALRGEVYHPLHSVMALLVHGVIGGWFVNDRMAWVASVQSVGIFFGAVVAVEIVILARAMGAPFWAAMGAGLVWSVGRRSSGYGADGLSDMLFLALFCGGMLVGMRGLGVVEKSGVRSESTEVMKGVWWFVLAGVLGGLAYLARPEGMAVVVVLGVGLLLLTVHGGEARGARWKLLGRVVVLPGRVVGPVLGLAGGFLLLSVPYMVVIGGITRKKSLVTFSFFSVGAGMVNVPGGGGHGIHWESVGKMGMELWETFGFGATIAVLGAMVMAPWFWGRRRLRGVMIVWVVVWVGVMVWLLRETGYLDGRHTLPLQLVLHGWLALAFVVWMKPMRWWMDWWRGKGVWGRLPRWMKWERWPYVMGVGAIVLTALPGVMRLGVAQGEEEGYMLHAAEWVRGHVKEGVVVCDRARLAGYYSGHPYVQWLGTPEKPGLEKLGVKGEVVIGYLFRPGLGEEVVGAIGDYRELARFESVGALHGDVYVLYGREGSGVMRGDGN